MNAVELHRVTLALGGRPVLADISLELAPSEFVGLLGPNGAGKTTLMRSILGLIPPAAGEIRVLGTTPRAACRAVGYMPQQRLSLANLHLSGRAYVGSVVQGARWGLPLLGREAAHEVDWALAMVGATDLAHRPLSEISGGERQRLLFAQALIGRPRLLLLDEPLISLDPRHQQEVVALAKSLQSELAITVLFSAHDLNPLLGALDRVLYLGQTQAALGPVPEVITTPVLSRLYGAPIEVIHLQGRIFVMSGDIQADPSDHHHEHGARNVRV